VTDKISNVTSLVDLKFIGSLMMEIRKCLKHWT